MRSRSSHSFPEFLACIFLLVSSGNAIVMASEPFTEFSAQYTVKKAGFELGQVTIQLNKTAEHYNYQSNTQPKGILALIRDDRVTERTVFLWQDQKILPQSYEYDHKGSRKNRNVHLTFQWHEHKVYNRVKGHTWSMDIPDGTLDKFSLQLAMMLDLQQGKKPSQYLIADGGKLKTYRFNVLEREKVDTPLGTFDTIKIERNRDNKKRITYSWCAPILGYLPVMVEHKENDGSRFKMKLSALTGIALPRQVNRQAAGKEKDNLDGSND